MQGYWIVNLEVLVGLQSKENTLGSLEKTLFAEESKGFKIQGYWKLQLNDVGKTGMAIVTQQRLSFL